MEPTELTHSADTSPAAEGSADTAIAAGQLVTDELLVEEISIDGMCGVY